MTAAASVQPGLTSTEAASRLAADGPNSLADGGRRTTLSILVAQVASPLVLILIAASLVSLVVGDSVNAAIIMAIVVMSAALGFVQEARSEAAVAALQARLTLRATVIRDGKPGQVPVHDVVRGDVVVLDAGDVVPADGRVLDANHLYVDEASLTGESAAAAKTPRDGDLDPTKDADRDGLVFFGTSVVSGTADVLVTATGARTSYGAIAQRLTERAPENDFQRGVRAFGSLIFRVTLILVIAVLAINLILHRPLLESLLFAIALAVGLTPELLPAIVTLNLTQGAHVLAAQGVLVKRLPSIQNLGSINVLCTDKTGTLTEGKLKLERTVGIDADDAGEAARALGLAWLNSHFQAGFENPLDAAVLAGATKPKGIAKYRKLAELPYDFNRRLLSVVVANGDEAPLLITKGAPEAVIARSTHVRVGDASRPIHAAEHKRLTTLVDGASADGYRLIAVGSRELAKDDLAPVAAKAGAPAPSVADAARLERDLVFEGVVLFSDPAKAGVADTVAELARLGVALKVVTGDNELVARHVAGEVGLAVDGVLTGDEMRTLSHPALIARVKRTTIFARVDPDQKLQVIRALHDGGSVVGYMGDGINDAPALHAADVGISVATAVDVAKEAADFVLLEQDLAILRQGIDEGRTTFANTLKYILATISANFGNMFSMAGASILLPFLPLLAPQILLNNFLADIPAMTIARDNVDPEMVAKPRRWNTTFIRNYMVLFGLVSSIFDFLTFGILLYVFNASPEEFRTGWFTESLLTELVIFMVVRTRHLFFRSRPGKLLLRTTLVFIALALALPYLPFVSVFGFVPLPAPLMLAMVGLTGLYVAATEVAKKYFYSRIQNVNV